MDSNHNEQRIILNQIRYLIITLNQMKKRYYMIKL